MSVRKLECKENTKELKLKTAFHVHSLSVGVPTKTVKGFILDKIKTSSSRLDK